MTKQEILDKQWDWFIVQDKPFGINENHICRYRGKGGAPCAVGLLIPDKKYRIGMEGDGLKDLMTEMGWDWSLHTFLVSTQSAHDNSSHFENGAKIEFARRLRGIAKAYDLTLPEGDPS